MTTRKRAKSLECRSSLLSYPDSDPELERRAAAWWQDVDSTRSREPNVTGPRHLVSLARPIHALARRAILIIDGSERTQDFSVVRQVLHYQEALVRLCDEVGAAMQSGSINARDELLGLRTTPPPFPDFRNWRDTRKVWTDLQTPDAAAPLTEAALTSAQELFPGILVDPVEFAAWAVAAGIAYPGELEKLLILPVDSPRSEEKLAPPGATWKDLARKYADEIYERESAMRCDPSKQSIATDIAKRFDEEGVRGKNGRLDSTYILRHGLSGWAKPTRVR